MEILLYIMLIWERKMSLALKAFLKKQYLKKKNICQPWKLTWKRIWMFSNIQDQTENREYKAQPCCDIEKIYSWRLDFDAGFELKTHLALMHKFCPTEYTALASSKALITTSCKHISIYEYKIPDFFLWATCVFKLENKSWQRYKRTGNPSKLQQITLC